ncbi:MAG: hypothetical protein ACK5TK_02580 [Betaproteobacteria bacterium]
MRRLANLPLLLAALAAAATLTACASTQVDAVWADPAAAGRKIEAPVLVVGVARDATVRRLFEDQMVAALKARGLAATPSYAATDPITETSGDALLAAARAQGARTLVSSAVTGQETETRVIQQAPPSWGVTGFSGWYGAWYGFSVPVRTEVRTFQTLLAQTAVSNVATGNVEWTARTRTGSPTNVEREVKGFVDAIVNAMTRSGLLPPAP